MSQIKVLSLDIGGVFFLGKADDAFFARWAAQMSLDPQKLQQLLWYGPDIEQANIGQITAEAYFERTAKRLDTTAENVRRIIEDAFFSPRNDELIAYIRKIKAQVRVIALTNNWSFANAMLEKNGMADLFELVVNSAEVGVKKPYPEIYRIMLEQAKVAAHEVLFVDDTLENIEVAQELGIRSIHFQSTEQTIVELDQRLSEMD